MRDRIFHIFQRLSAARILQSLGQVAERTGREIGRRALEAMGGSTEPIGVMISHAPMLAFRLHVSDGAAGDGTDDISCIVLRCQIRIEPTKRRYTSHEQEQLIDLYGPPERWGQTLRAMLWTHTSAVVPGFSGSTLIDLPVPCTYDFNLAATKYFHALQDGEVPLNLLFSGTVFHTGAGGVLQVAQIPWEKEASFRLPVRIWQEQI